MNSRLEALIKRGYSKDDVIRLSSFTEEELEYASKIAFEYIIKNCTSVENPQAIYIGGQPGSGKSVLSMQIKDSMQNIIEIGVDNYRMYHPHYFEIEECIKKHWEGKTETIDSSPGNDIADFTHLFAGVMCDRLMELGSQNKYNMLLEWGMREPDGPLASMENLKSMGYNNTVLFVTTNKETSYEACNLRANVIGNVGPIIRKVPKSFHDFSIATLPDSINKIYLEGFSKKIIDKMALVKRNGKILWDETFGKMPSDVFTEYINNNETKEKNSQLLALSTTKTEMIGLESQLNNIYTLEFENFFKSM